MDLLHTHTQCCLGQIPLHWFATLWPSNGRETFICVEKWGEIYKKSGFNAGSAFPSC